MLETHSEEFQQRFIADARTVPDVTLTMDAATALAVIAHLQLALRHPQNRGYSSGIIRDFTRRLIDLVALTPALRLGLEAGFDEAHDIERKPHV